MPLKNGVYVDAENIRLNGGFGIRYDVLRRFAERNGGYVQRLNTCMAIDKKRWEEDAPYREKQHMYQQRLREFGWYIYEKAVKRFREEDGNIVVKANADMELAIDALVPSDHLDQVVLPTGDGDFCRLVHALQTKGCRVEVIAFQNVSSELKRSADFFLSGFLIPGLLPIENGGEWGKEGSRVRGLLRYTRPEKNFGFIHYLHQLDANLWVVDDRQTDSSYRRAVVLEEDLPQGIDLARIDPEGIGVEFRLKANDHPEPRFMAKDCKIIPL